MVAEPIRFTKAKNLIASFITSDLIGWIIGNIFRDNIPSYNLLVNTQWASSKIKASVFFRIYESAEIKFIKQYLPYNIDVIELGSSLGILSSHIATQITDNHRLICVEANPKLLDSIEFNLQLNAKHLLTYNIVNAAIDYRGKDEIDFFLGDQTTTSSTTQITEQKQAIKSTTLSQIVKIFNFKKYALVMDIEGAEIDLFLYENEALKKCNLIIAELHEGKSLVSGVFMSVNDLIQLISRRGFTLSKQRGSVVFFER